MKILIKKSILASLLIACGVGIQLTIGNPIGAFLFAFGLLGVCALEANLYTGKIGLLWRTKRKQLIIMLFVNLISAWLFGFLLSISNPNLVIEAENRILSWEFSAGFFLDSILCGMIMYIMVVIYKRKSVEGIAIIILGIPLFIMSGFQHCIANMIILGIAKTLSPHIITVIIGNTLGSIVADILNNIE